MINKFYSLDSPWIYNNNNVTGHSINSYFKLYKNRMVINEHLPSIFEILSPIEIAKKNSNDFFTTMRKGEFNIYLENLFSILTAFKIGTKRQIIGLGRRFTSNVIKNIYDFSEKGSIYQGKTNSISESIFDCIFIWTTSAYGIIANIYRQLYFNKNNGKKNTFVKQLNLLVIDSLFKQYLKPQEPPRAKISREWDHNKTQINNDLFNYQYECSNDINRHYSNIEVIAYITCLYDFINLGNTTYINLNQKLEWLGIKKINYLNFSKISGLFSKNKILLFRGCGIDTYFNYRKKFNTNTHKESLLIQSTESYTSDFNIALNFAQMQQLIIENNITVPQGIFEINIVHQSVPLLYISSLSKYKSEEEFLIKIFSKKFIIGKAQFPIGFKIKLNKDSTIIFNKHNHKVTSNGLVIISEIF